MFQITDLFTVDSQSKIFIKYNNYELIGDIRQGSAREEEQCNCNERKVSQ